jgi:hypothetical protein
MPGGRPGKPLSLVEGHRTNAEKEARKEAEKAIFTNIEMHEWTDTKKRAAAHREFIRLKEVFAAIQKDDSLYEGVINRYCLLTAESGEYETLKASLRSDMRKISKAYKNKEIDFLTFLDRNERIQTAIFACDKKIMDRRKMLLDIEKESGMTHMSQLRMTTKAKPKEQPKNPMEAAGFDI